MPANVIQSMEISFEGALSRYELLPPHTSRNFSAQLRAQLSLVCTFRVKRDFWPRPIFPAVSGDGVEAKQVGRRWVELGDGDAGLPRS